MSIKNYISRWTGKSVRQVIMLSATFISLFPIYFMVVSALKSQDEYRFNTWGLPISLYLHNFHYSYQSRKILGSLCKQRYPDHWFGCRFISLCMHGRLRFCPNEIPRKTDPIQCHFGFDGDSTCRYDYAIVHLDGSVGSGKHLSRYYPNLYRVAIAFLYLSDDEFL